VKFDNDTDTQPDRQLDLDALHASPLPMMTPFPLLKINPEWREQCMATTYAGQRCKSKGRHRHDGWVHCGRKGHAARRTPHARHDDGLMLDAVELTTPSLDAREREAAGS
jgi:hypothetical protein